MFSVGRDGSTADLPSDPDDSLSQRLPVRWVARGGGTWRHGPGQLSLSVLAPIERLGFSPCELRQKLVRGVMETARELHIPSHSAAAAPGVQGRVGQFAFVGASVQGGVSQFGLIVNVAPDWAVTSFSPHGVRSSSLAAERLRPIAMATVRESLARHLSGGLEYKEWYIHTGHPWLRRTRRTVPIHA
jgi:lipoate-protein ligase B